MKKTILSLALLLLGGMGLTAWATGSGNTLVIEDVQNYDNTSVVSSDSTLVDNLGKVAELRRAGKEKKWDSDGYLNIGLNTMTGAPSEYEFKIWPSFEIALGATHSWRPFGKHNTWSLGLGVDWRNYRLSNKTAWVKNDATDYMELWAYSDGLSHRRTSLNVFSLQIPVMYTHTFDEKGDWGVTLGALVNFNTGAHTTRAYRKDGEDHTIKSRGIGQRPVTVDGLLVIHNPILPGLYVKYSPMTFFKDNRGPKMHQLSFGFWF